ncbi:MAG: low molecular weight protein arginine phosphatase [Puniceicoccales bacterium]|jgi:protein-tyrosine-phosphatase|nr:low molecular weight protein arginine phosphatase [Puniceicoccales bacterium]
MADERPPKHVTFVCTGNICRSPMAEGLLRHALQAEPEPLRSLRVLSTGLAAYTGEPASPNAVRALKNVGIDIASHRSRSTTPEIVNHSLAVFVMTTQHLQALTAHFPNRPAGTHLMRALIAGDVPREIPDPYGMGLADYEACRDSMVEAIPSIVAFLRKIVADETPLTDRI